MRPGIRALSGLLSRFSSLCRASCRVVPGLFLRRYRALLPRFARLFVQCEPGKQALRKEMNERKAMSESQVLHTIGASDKACVDSQNGTARQLARANEEHHPRGPETLIEAGLCRRRRCAWIW